MKDKDTISMLSSLFHRHTVEDSRIATNCDGTKTFTIIENKGEGITDTTKYIFPKSYFDGNNDGNSTPIVEYTKSSNAMLLEYSREPMTENMFALV